MKTTISCHKNTPTTIDGYSITVTFTYSSFDKEEIDRLEEQLPTGIIFSDKVIACQSCDKG